MNNSRTAFMIIGASNHTEEEREENDFYATDPKAAELLLEVEELSNWIWEPACGKGHLSEVFKDNGHKVFSTDLIDRGYGGTGDFFLYDKVPSSIHPCDIVTNPPFKIAQDFVQHALDIQEDGRKVCMFLKLSFLEGQKRKSFFEKNPPKTVYVSSSRLRCAKNGDFEKYGKGVSTAIAYAWFVWEKGYRGETIVKWIN